MPGGLDGQGLPLGLHLIGNELDEQSVLNAGLAIEERRLHAAGEVVVSDVESRTWCEDRLDSNRTGRLPHQRRNRRVGGRDRPRGPRAGHRRNAKLFSGAATAFGAEPNTQVSLVDAAMPGMLPVPNRECIRQAVRTGMALDAEINRWSRFDRKNYFYADLPQGYQISQLYHPLVGEGEVEILLDEKDENQRQADRHRAHPRRAGRGQADARPASDDELRRPQPLRASR